MAETPKCVIEVVFDKKNKSKPYMTSSVNGFLVKSKELEDSPDVISIIEHEVQTLAKLNNISQDEISVISENEQLRKSLQNKGVKTFQKSTKDKDYYDSYYGGYIYEPVTPWGVINFDDLKEAQAARELREDFSDLFIQYIEMGQRIIDGNYVLEFGDERGPLALMSELTNQFLTELTKATAQNNGDVRKELKTEQPIVETVEEVPAEVIEEVIEEEVVNKELQLVVKSKGVLLFKNAANELIWAGVHSNKFKDRDNDILKDKSHRRFVQKVYDGEYPFPELWIWHIEKAVGETNWLAYDERGFLLSGGKVFPEYEELVVDLVKNTSEMGMSHGMPVESVIYDDDGFIDEYQSVEVTMLPLSEAANILTSFTVGKN